MRGPYYKAVGDGRELCVTVPTATFVRAEDGRRVEHVDISPLIRTLPGGRRTDDFSSPDASGSTSQAANLIEAVEAGAGLLLLDEDSCATNAMVRDPVMQRLVAERDEPIIPFVDRVRGLVAQHSLAVVMVMGASSAFFARADAVYQFREYHLLHVTAEARAALAAAAQEGGEAAAAAAARDPGQDGDAPEFGQITPRAPDWSCLGRLLHESHKTKVRANWRGSARDIQFGQHLIDMSACLAALSPAQADGVATILQHLAKSVDTPGRGRAAAPPLPQTQHELADMLQHILFRAVPGGAAGAGGARRGATGRTGLFHPVDSFMARGFFNRSSASPRPIEVVMALNRLRQLTIRLHRSA